MLFRLFYISKATAGVTKTDYEKILAASRRNNRLIDVTGLLVVKGDYFAQVLEGKAETVNSLYEKISLDERHGGVVKVRSEEADKRIFPGWDMGFKDINNTGAQIGEIDFSDPKYVKDPNELSTVFKKFVNG